MVIEMIKAQALKVLLNCIETIELCLETKEEFLASLTLQDKVLSSLDELSVMSRTIDWGYRGTIAETAWRSITNLVFQNFKYLHRGYYEYFKGMLSNIGGRGVCELE